MFALGWTLTSSGSVALLRRDVSPSAPQLQGLGVDLSTWAPLVQDRALVSWIAPEPSPEAARGARRPGSRTLAALEAAWAAGDVGATAEAVEAELAATAAEQPTPVALRYASAQEHAAIFLPLLELEADAAKVAEEARGRRGIQVRWESQDAFAADAGFPQQNVGGRDEDAGQATARGGGAPFGEPADGNPSNAASSAFPSPKKKHQHGHQHGAPVTFWAWVPMPRDEDCVRMSPGDRVAFFPISDDEGGDRPRKLLSLGAGSGAASSASLAGGAGTGAGHQQFGITPAYVPPRELQGAGAGAGAARPGGGGGPTGRGFGDGCGHGSAQSPSLSSSSYASPPAAARNGGLSSAGLPSPYPTGTGAASSARGRRGKSSRELGGAAFGAASSFPSSSSSTFHPPAFAGIVRRLDDEREAVLLQVSAPPRWSPPAPPANGYRMEFAWNGGAFDTLRTGLKRLAKAGAMTPRLRRVLLGAEPPECDDDQAGRRSERDACRGGGTGSDGRSAGAGKGAFGARKERAGERATHDGSERGNVGEGTFCGAQRAREPPLPESASPGGAVSSAPSAAPEEHDAGSAFPAPPATPAPVVDAGFEARLPPEGAADLDLSRARYDAVLQRAFALPPPDGPAPSTARDRDRDRDGEDDDGEDDDCRALASSGRASSIPRAEGGVGARVSRRRGSLAAHERRRPLGSAPPAPRAVPWDALDPSAPGLARLNESQAEAVRASLSSTLTLVQGPPGTGKTQMCASAIYRMVRGFSPRDLDREEAQQRGMRGAGADQGRPGTGYDRSKAHRGDLDEDLEEQGEEGVGEDRAVDAVSTSAFASAARSKPALRARSPPPSSSSSSCIPYHSRRVLTPSLRTGVPVPPRSGRALVAAPSNVAVDNLAVRLRATGLRVVRLFARSREGFGGDAAALSPATLADLVYASGRAKEAIAAGKVCAKAPQSLFDGSVDFSWWPGGLGDDDARACADWADDFEGGPIAQAEKASGGYGAGGVGGNKAGARSNSRAGGGGGRAGGGAGGVGGGSQSLSKSASAATAKRSGGKAASSAAAAASASFAAARKASGGVPSAVSHAALTAAAPPLSASSPSPSSSSRPVRLLDPSKASPALLELLRRSVVACAEAVVCTCAVAGDKRITGLSFTSVLVDEAAQSVEPEALVPLTRGAARVALVGDHRQLGPTVVSSVAARAGLSMSLFERLAHLGVVPHRLLVQYRMPPSLAAWPALAFYDGVLQSARVEKGHAPAKGADAGRGADDGWSRRQGHEPESFSKGTRDVPPAADVGTTAAATGPPHLPPASARSASSALPSPSPSTAFPWPTPAAPLAFWAVQGVEELASNGTSFLNRLEAEAVVAVVATLLKAGVRPDSLGVVTPYVGQRSRILKALREAPDVRAAAEKAHQTRCAGTTGNERGRASAQAQGGAEASSIANGIVSHAPMAPTAPVPSASSAGPDAAADPASLLASEFALSAAVSLPATASDAAYRDRLSSTTHASYLGIEVASVDEFQGREKEYIIFSCTRTSTRGIGFLADPRRLNVAVTRAREGLVLLGSPAALVADPLWSWLIAHCSNLGAVVSGPAVGALSRIRVPQASAGRAMPRRGFRPVPWAGQRGADPHAREEWKANHGLAP